MEVAEAGTRIGGKRYILHQFIPRACSAPSPPATESYTEFFGRMFGRIQRQRSVRRKDRVGVRVQMRCVSAAGGLMRARLVVCASEVDVRPDRAVFGEAD